MIISGMQEFKECVSDHVVKILPATKKCVKKSKNGVKT